MKVPLVFLSVMISCFASLVIVKQHGHAIKSKADEQLLRKELHILNQELSAQKDSSPILTNRRLELIFALKSHGSISEDVQQSAAELYVEVPSTDLLVEEDGSSTLHMSTIELKSFLPSSIITPIITSFAISSNISVIGSVQNATIKGVLMSSDSFNHSTLLVVSILQQGRGNIDTSAIKSVQAVRDISVLIVRVTYADYRGDPVTADDIARQMLLVRKHLSISSYGSLNVGSFQVTPTFGLPQKKAFYQMNPNAHHAVYADTLNVTESRLAFDNYSCVIIAFPQTFADWKGKGVVGGKLIWLNGEFGAATIAHELGHNFGLFHSNFFDQAKNNVVEYGDPYDIMGTGRNIDLHQYNLVQKLRLGWIPSELITTATSSGRFELFPFDCVGCLKLGNVGIKIPVGGGNHIFISYRSMLQATNIPYAMLEVHLTYDSYTAMNSTSILSGLPFSQVLSNEKRFTSLLVLPFPPLKISIRQMPSDCLRSSTACSTKLDIVFSSANHRFLAGINSFLVAALLVWVIWFNI